MNSIYEIVPSEEALHLIKARLPSADTYLAVARTGSHHMNPYHNLTHELGVVYWAYSCWINSEHEFSPALNDFEVDEQQKYGVSRLLFASLFHDHNHSGGRTSDKENVERARAILLQIDSQKLEQDFGRGWSQIDRMIACTEFTAGKFPIEPQSFAAECIRDADLMTIYSNEGRHLLLGLLDEIGIGMPQSQTEVDEVMARQDKFLSEAPMFTEFGTFMRAHYLRQALTLFRYLLISRLPIGNRSPSFGYQMMVNQQATST